MRIGVFLPINSRGWLVSTTAPATMATFDLNRAITQRAEHFGLDFVLSMIKLRGYAGPSEFWVHGLEPLTMTAGLAAVTHRIQLFASASTLLIPPAVLARMAVTLDSIAPGRIGINIVTGWQPAEYSQMGLWPGSDYFDRRYDQATEYVRVLKELWTTGRSDFRGEFFAMEDCRLSPRPRHPIPIVGAGASDRGLRFVAEEGNFNFIGVPGLNEVDGIRPAVARAVRAAETAGRDVGPFVVVMIIADSTDERAFAKWEHYKTGTDLEALGWQVDQASGEGGRDPNSTGARMTKALERPEPTGMLKLIGSYENVAAMLDRIAETAGLKGIMLTFDDFMIGIEQFGDHIQPLMRCRQEILAAQAGPVPA